MTVSIFLEAPRRSALRPPAHDGKPPPRGAAGPSRGPNPPRAHGRAGAAARGTVSRDSSSSSPATFSPPRCLTALSLFSPACFQCFLRQLLFITVIFFFKFFFFVVFPPPVSVATCSSPQALSSEMHSLGFAPACRIHHPAEDGVHLFGIC